MADDGAEQPPQPKPDYKKSDAELRRLAMDYCAGAVFIDRDAGSIEQIRSSFMSLALAGPEHLAPLREFEKLIIYEHMSKAGPLAVNGKPCFFSCQFIVNDDVDTFAKYVEMFLALRGGDEGDQENSDDG